MTPDFSNYRGPKKGRTSAESDAGQNSCPCLNEPNKLIFQVCIISTIRIMKISLFYTTIGLACDWHGEALEEIDFKAVLLTIFFVK